ncbi:MAG: sugar-binding domain-containing protein, partial [Planctomycetota bacterium]
MSFSYDFKWGVGKSAVFFIAIVFSSLIADCSAVDNESSKRTISLEGQWSFKLDPENVGITEKWFNDSFSESITLPGSTDQAGFGNKVTSAHKDRLTREYEYVGAAWYEKTVTIPDGWAGNHIELFLERCHWETRVWVDGEEMGMRESLSVPHIYDLTACLTPGEHSIVVRVDNTIKYQIGGAGHSITDYTQTNWNGIVGRLELRASSPVWIESVVRAYPNIKAKSVRVHAEIRNITAVKVEGPVVAKVFDADKKLIGESVITKTISPGGTAELEFDVKLDGKVILWDEFNPSLYDLELSFADDFYTVPLGMRQVGVKDKRIAINDRPV